jgi:hypothetical protein
MIDSVFDLFLGCLAGKFADTSPVGQNQSSKVQNSGKVTESLRTMDDDGTMLVPGSVYFFNKLELREEPRESERQGPTMSSNAGPGAHVMRNRGSTSTRSSDAEASGLSLEGACTCDARRPRQRALRHREDREETEIQGAIQTSWAKRDPAVNGEVQAWMSLSISQTASDRGEEDEEPQRSRDVFPLPGENGQARANHDTKLSGCGKQTTASASAGKPRPSNGYTIFPASLTSRQTNHLAFSLAETTQPRVSSSALPSATFPARSTSASPSTDGQSHFESVPTSPRSPISASTSPTHNIATRDTFRVSHPRLRETKPSSTTSTSRSCTPHATFVRLPAVAMLPTAPGTDSLRSSSSTPASIPTSPISAASACAARDTTADTSWGSTIEPYSADVSDARPEALTFNSLAWRSFGGSWGSLGQMAGGGRRKEEERLGGGADRSAEGAVGEGGAAPIGDVRGGQRRGASERAGLEQGQGQGQGRGDAGGVDAGDGLPLRHAVRHSERPLAFEGLSLAFERLSASEPLSGESSDRSVMTSDLPRPSTSPLQA